MYQNKYFNISGDRDPERLMAARISSSVFPMLGDPARTRLKSATSKKKEIASRS